MPDSYEEQKSSNGGLSTIVFLITTAILLIAGPGFGSVFSLRGLLFVVVGMFAAAIAIGIPVYFVQRGVSKLLTKSIKDPFLGNSVMAIKTVGIVIFLAQVGITAFITYVAFSHVMHA